jgi:MFS family permease
MVMSEGARGQGTDLGAHPPGLDGAWYTTIVLAIAYAFSFLDRQILNLMVGPIKHDFHLSDVQFAMLTGGAFGIFYTLMALPLGWLADRYNRKWIISVGIGLWSLMTASCGLARNYAALLLARIGVGVGEATLSPSTYSMLSDLFDPERLPRAMSMYCLGIYMGAGASMILGGIVVTSLAQYPAVDLPIIGTVTSWHLVFLAVGLPGLLVALLIAGTVREPPRRRPRSQAPDARTGGRSHEFSIRVIARFLRQSPRMSVALFLGSAVLSILSNIDNWYPELFIRTWGWSARVAGVVNGTASFTAGSLGMLTAGFWSSHLLRRGKSDACLRLTVYIAAIAVVPGTLMPLMPNAHLMAMLVFPLKFIGGFVPVLIPSAIQMVSPPALRAQMGAVFLLTVGVIGVSLGPLLPAFFSDYLFHNEQSLRFSLALSAAIVAPLACVLLSLGLTEFRERLASAAA